MTTHLASPVTSGVASPAATTVTTHLATPVTAGVDSPGAATAGYNSIACS